MSKYVKDLVTNELRKRLVGVGDALLVDVVGMANNENVVLRRRLREKHIQLLVVKNSLARRATEGTTLGPALAGVEGTVALVWGGEDIVSLAKEIMRLAGQDEFAPFAPKGGVMDGQPLSADDVKQVSRWPTRQEQLAILVGQLLSPGATLAAQLTTIGGALVGQIKHHAENLEMSGDGQTAPPASQAS